MSLKEKLIKMRNRITGEQTPVKEEETIDSPKKEITRCVIAKNLSLDDKVNDFLDWYYKNIVIGNITDTGAYHAVTDLRNLIEKMAVWYELRYPDYSINRILPGSIQENLDISTIMFDNNHYINEQLDENAETRVLDWEKFYNVESFIASLPWKERSFFQKPKYKSLVYIDFNAHLHLTKDGIIEESEWLGISTGHVIEDKDIEGMHVKELRVYLQKKGIILPPHSELTEMFLNIDNQEKLREGLLDSVMYRIIERGGNRIGPRRGFLFAQEFKRNIDIPMMYGVDYSDPGLRNFINQYLKAGGSKELVCYSDYFTCTSKYSILGVTTIDSMLHSVWNDELKKYTPEETELHQKLVTVLSNQVDPEILKKEQVKQLRIERKLEKSRRNS